MKISVDDKELFSLNETQKKVIMNDVHADIFENDMNRRLQYILMHKYSQCFKRLKAEWDPKLHLAGIKSVPTDPDEYAQLIFSQSGYTDRKRREEKI